jgi:hypothetical protein
MTTMSVLRERLSAVFWFQYVCDNKMGRSSRGLGAESAGSNKVRATPNTVGGRGLILKVLILETDVEE